MSDPKQPEPTQGQFHHAVVNPDATLEEQAALDAMAEELSNQLMEIFLGVKAEVEAKKAPE